MKTMPFVSKCSDWRCSGSEERRPCHKLSTSRTDGQTDRNHTTVIPRCARVYRVVKELGQSIRLWGQLYPLSIRIATCLPPSLSAKCYFFRNLLSFCDWCYLNTPSINQSNSHSVACVTSESQAHDAAAAAAAAADDDRKKQTVTSTPRGHTYSLLRRTSCDVKRE